jgi:hypothetical protein
MPCQPTSLYLAHLRELANAVIAAPAIAASVREMCMIPLPAGSLPFGWPG